MYSFFVYFLIFISVLQHLKVKLLCDNFSHLFLGVSTSYSYTLAVQLMDNFQMQQKLLSNLRILKKIYDGG